MTFLYVLGILSLVCNLIGVWVSMIMLTQAWGDRRYVRQSGLNGSRRAITQFAVEAESIRLTVQTLLAINRTPGLYHAEDIYSPLVNDLWGLVLNSTITLTIASVLLMVMSWRSWHARNKVIEDGMHVEHLLKG